MNLEVLQNIWFFLIGFLLMMYSILDGFDLGVGILYGFIAKTQEDKKVLLNSLAPFWDGNEVWLLTGAGALFAAFPVAYASVFSGFYLAMFIILFALIFRAVSFEFLKYDEKRQKLWGIVLQVSSLLPAVIFGVAIGNLVQGVEINSNLEFQGNFGSLFSPFTLATGLLGLFAFLLQGASYISLKSSGDLKNRADRSFKILSVLFITSFLFTFLTGLFFFPHFADVCLSNMLSWLAVAGLVAALLISWIAQKKSKFLVKFLATSTIFVALWGIIASDLYPNFVRATDLVNNITIYNASSSEKTLGVLLVITAIGMPLVITSFIVLYKVFRNKTKSENVNSEQNIHS